MARFAAIGWLVLALSVAPAWAAGDHEGEEDHEHGPVPAAGPVRVPAQELVVRIRGVVCSFCAYGMEKALRKVDVVDRTRHRDGVVVDIDAQQIRLALHADRAIPYTELHDRMIRGGYEPVSFHVRVEGALARSDGGWLLTDASSQQQYAVSGAPAAWLREEERVAVQARIDADGIAELPAGAPVPAAFERLAEAEERDGDA